MAPDIATLGVVLPAAALTYGTLMANIAATLGARSADPQEAAEALHIASLASSALIIAAAATRGPTAAVGAAIVVAAVAVYWHRYVL